MGCTVSGLAGGQDITRITYFSALPGEVDVWMTGYEYLEGTAVQPEFLFWTKLCFHSCGGMSKDSPELWLQAFYFVKAKACLKCL